MFAVKAKLSLFKNKIPKLHLGTFNVLLALWLGIALNFSFYEKIKSLTPYESIQAQLFLIATVVIVVAAYNFILQILTWKWTTKAIAIFFVTIGGMSSYFVSNFGIIINAEQIQNMVQTDVREVRDLISLKYFIWLLFMVILPIIMILFIQIRPETSGRLLIKKLLSASISIIIILALLFSFYIDFAAMFREHRYLKGMISPNNVFAASLSYYNKQRPKQNLPLIIYGEDAHVIQKVNLEQAPPKLMVLVVGETARAESFSLNGYAKNTNPELSKQDIINFPQVSSCGTSTAVSVPCMFSGMSRRDYDDQLASHREGLLDIAQRAGYKVTWIDNNSGCKGACDRVETYKIPEQIQQKWCDADGECLDEILLDALKSYMAQIPKDDHSPRLIVLHQMGSHGPAYFKRSTKAFQKFQPTCDTNAIQGCNSEHLLNTYDNSILYTDHVLSQTIDFLKGLTNYRTGFWYLSDHGESTGEKGMYLHGAPYSIAPSQQTHIPMLMWFSPEWQKNDASQVNCINTQKNQPLSHDHLFPTLLSLLDVHTQVSDNQSNILQTCTAPKRT